jgi:hypothetical protein
MTKVKKFDIKIIEEGRLTNDELVNINGGLSITGGGCNYMCTPTFSIDCMLYTNCTEYTLCIGNCFESCIDGATHKEKWKAIAIASNNSSSFTVSIANISTVKLL